MLMLLSREQTNLIERRGCAQVSNTEAEAAASKFQLGPVMGNVTGAVATKSEDFPLPQNALVSCLLPAQSHHLHASTQASSIVAGACCNMAGARLECAEWQRCTTAACSGSLEPKADRCLSVWCVGQVGSPLLAPEPGLAPCPGRLGGHCDGAQRLLFLALCTRTGST